MWYVGLFVWSCCVFACFLGVCAAVGVCLLAGWVVCVLVCVIVGLTMCVCVCGVLPCPFGLSCWVWFSVVWLLCVGVV